MRLELTRQTLHGDTDQIARAAYIEANHRASYPQFRDDAELAPLDAQYAADLQAAEERGQVITDEQRAFLPSAAYAAQPMKPPPMPPNVCDVVAVYVGEGVRMEVHTQDWDEAAALAMRETLTVEV